VKAQVLVATDFSPTEATEGTEGSFPEIRVHSRSKTLSTASVDFQQHVDLGLGLELLDECQDRFVASWNGAIIEAPPAALTIAGTDPACADPTREDFRPHT
jgi:hypothetical protein